MDPPWIENRCLEYHYTKLGRWTYFGWWTPHMKLSVVDNQLVHDLLEIYVFNKSSFETAQVYSSSVPVRLSIGASMCLVRAHVKVLKFTGQGYSSSLLVSFTPHLKLSLRADQVFLSMCAVRAHSKQLAELGHLNNSFTFCKAVYSIIWCSAIEEVSSTFITYAHAGDMSSCKWRNLCKFQVAVVFCCAYDFILLFLFSVRITHRQQQFTLLMISCYCCCLV